MLVYDEVSSVDDDNEGSEDENSKKGNSDEEIEDENYSVEAIVDDRTHKGSKQLLISWKHYKKNTWEPEATIRDTMHDDVARYFRLKHISSSKNTSKCCYPGCIFNMATDKCQNEEGCDGRAHHICQNQYDVKQYNGKFDKTCGMKILCYVCFEEMLN